MAYYEASLPPSRDPYYSGSHSSSRYNYSPSSNHYETSQRSSRTPHSSNSYLSMSTAEPHVRPSRSSYSLRPQQSEPLYRSSSSRRRWPPAPLVEDEAVASAREFPPSLTLSVDELESRGPIDSRGSVFQESLLEQLLNLDTRFVLLSDSQSSTDSRVSKNDALKRAAKRRQREARISQETLRLNIATTPVLERVSTPYSYTKPETNRTISGDYLQSPETLFPPPLSNLPKTRPTTPASAGLGISDLLGQQRSTRLDSSEDSSDIDKRESNQRRAAHGRRSARGSAVEQLTVPIRNGRVEDKAAPKSPSLRKTASRASLGLSIPIIAAAADKLDPRRSPAPGSPSIASSRRDTRSDSYYGSSPGREGTRHASTGKPSSPRLTAQRRDDYGMSSRSNSRPSSPSSPYEPFAFESPVDKHDRHASAPVASSTKTKQPSKLSSEVRPSPVYDERPSYSRGASRGTPYPGAMSGQGGPLPYPDAYNFVAMPSEHSFLRTDSFNSSATMERSGSLTSNQSTTSSSGRQPGNSAHRLSKTSNPRSSYDSIGESRAVPPTPPTSLPPCPRRKFSNKYDDWWSLESFPDFDVCPHCLDSIVRPTQFRRSFTPARRRPSNMLVRCDFGSPWARAAWLLTMKQGREDLSLITGLASIWEMEKPCPSTESSSGPWWSLVDPNLYFIPNFQICTRDKATIEHLFPALAGAFTKIPSSSQARHLCTLRVESPRFSTFINVMDDLNNVAVQRYLHDAATSSSWDLRPRKLTGTADTRTLHDLARSMGLRPECPQDQVDEKAIWHYIPDYPELTVCPDCFDTVVRPDLSQAIGMATLFTAVPQALGYSSSARSLMSNGLTCQLYSPRMRDIWRTAAEGDDVEYFVRKLRDRRSMEVQLRQQKTELVEMLNRGNMDIHYGGGVSRDRLKDNLSRVTKAWEDFE